MTLLFVAALAVILGAVILGLVMMLRDRAANKQHTPTINPFRADETDG